MENQAQIKSTAAASMVGRMPLPSPGKINTSSIEEIMAANQNPNAQQFGFKNMNPQGKSYLVMHRLM